MELQLVPVRSRRCENFINTLAKEGRTLPKRVKSPWTSNYRPETDTSTDIPPQRAAYYQSMISVIRWITELGRVDTKM